MILNAAFTLLLGDNAAVTLSDSALTRLKIPLSSSASKYSLYALGVNKCSKLVMSL